MALRNLHKKGTIVLDSKVLRCCPNGEGLPTLMSSDPKIVQRGIEAGRRAMDTLLGK